MIESYRYIVSVRVPHTIYYDVVEIDDVADCGDHYEVTGGHTNLFIDKAGCEVDIDPCDGIVKSLRNNSICISLML